MRNLLCCNSFKGVGMILIIKGIVRSFTLDLILISYCGTKQSIDLLHCDDRTTRFEDLLPRTSNSHKN